MEIWKVKEGILALGMGCVCCAVDQGRDIPPNSEPAASPRRLQFATTTIPPGRGGGQFGPMVLQPDFRKVSGISTEIFRQLEVVENDHDATTAAALGAVERRGEMLVRLLDPRQFSRPVQDQVRKFLQMQDALHSVHFVEIVKRPGQTLGLYIREGNGVDRYDGVFVSRIAIESAVYNSGCLGVGDEILAVNLVDVTRMSLDDVVILMSIPRRLVLTIRQRKGRGGALGMSASHSSMLRSESKLPPVVVIKKELEDEHMFDENDENNHLLGYPSRGMQHSHSHSHPHAPHPHHTMSGYPGGPMAGGRGRTQAPHPYQTGGRLFGTGTRQALTPLQQAQANAYGQYASPSMHSLSRGQGVQPPSYQHQQPHYANIPFQQGGVGAHLPDVASATDSSYGVRGDSSFRLDAAPQPPIRQRHYSDFDPYASMQDSAGSTHSHSHHHHRPTSRAGGGPVYGQYPDENWYSNIGRSASAGVGRISEEVQQAAPPSISYQPPPPVITEQPRPSLGPQHFQPFDRAYPKTLESLAEKVHTFYTGPRPQRQQNGRRMPRTGSDHRLSLGRGGAEPPWYGGSMPRQRPGDPTFGGRGMPVGGVSRYGAGMSGRLGALQQRRKGPLDYASDSETMTSYPSIRSALPAATRRSLGLSGGGGGGAVSGRSNSLPRDLLRGRGGRKSHHSVRFDNNKGGSGGNRALLLAALDSQDESDGALSAPEMPLTPRRERDYRAWLTRAPSTSAIYERLKTNRDLDLLQTQKAAKLTYSAENLSLLDKARTRTERQLKLLTESLERENLQNLAQWEAQQQMRQQEQQRPYYSYRTHLSTTSPLTGGDSTLARALGGTTATGRSPSTSSALAALGIREPPAGAATPGVKESLSSDPLRSLGRITSGGITPSRSRDLLSTDASGRRSPASALLHRISAEKDESLLRKEILSRSLIGRDLLSRESLKDDLVGDLEKSAAARLGVAATPTGLPGIPGQPSALLTGRLPPSAAAGLTSTITTPVGTGSIASTGTGDSRLKLLTINPSEFSRYKIERPQVQRTPQEPQDGQGQALSPSLTPHILNGHSGILRVHLLAGRALRSTVKTTDHTPRTRDLYCVLECDRVHKARTVVCTGDQNFDWDELFDLDLVTNKELDFLIYSWDPQLRHRLCYKGSVNLVQVLASLNTNAEGYHQLAIKVEPRGTLYVKLKHTPPQEAFKREPKPGAVFGAQLAAVVMKEDSGLNVPLIVQRCIEEIERRGLDIIGLYRLCGSASKKQTLREAFERSPKTVDLSAENVPDINVITGVLKDYLRETPEPLLSNSLYGMLVDALGVCLPDDPEGNARLLYSIIECLPKPNRCTLLLILEHLSLVCSLSDRNKMGPLQIAQCFGPILMIHCNMIREDTGIDFGPPIKVLQYLLETWPAKSVLPLLQTVRDREAGREVVRKGSGGPSALYQVKGVGGQQPHSPQSLQSPKGAPPLLPRSSQPASSILLSNQRGMTSAQGLAQGAGGNMTHQYQQYQSSTTNSLSSSQQLSNHKGVGFQSNHQQGVGLLTQGTSPYSSLSESSPSPTTNLGRDYNKTIPPPHSSPSGAGVTPSTTSSSLTSSSTSTLTPTHHPHPPPSHPQTTTSASNYSLTSEFSTTSVTSPTPSHHQIVSTSSTRESLFFHSTSTGGGVQGGYDREKEKFEDDNVFPTVSVRSRASAFETSNQPQPHPLPNGGGGAVPPMGIGALLQQDLYGEKVSNLYYNQQSMPRAQPPQGPAVPPSPFMGRRVLGGPGPQGGVGPLPGRVEREPAPLEDNNNGESTTTTTSSNSSNASISSKRRLPSIPKSFSSSQEDNNATVTGGGGGETTPKNTNGNGNGNGHHHDPSASLRKSSQSSEEGSEDINGKERDYTTSQSSGYSSYDPPPYPPPQMVMGGMGMGMGMGLGGNKKPVPPPPPPKPGFAVRQRLTSSASSDSGSEQEDGVTPPSRSDRPRSNGHMDTQGGTNGGSGGSSGGSSTTTPTTVQSQPGGGSGSKGSSPGTTPMGTPPPVPPRLDRRPSQPSPTSSPPAMPPPVPPRLGRAAPVRTPSLDGREAFEVDCYTIKEENGEEDFLT